MMKLPVCALVSGIPEAVYVNVMQSCGVATEAQYVRWVRYQKVQ